MREARPNIDRRHRPGGARRAFTLVEMLVVIGILAILVALVSGIARHVFEESSRKETVVILDTLMSAVNAFHDVRVDVDPTHSYPNQEVAQSPDTDPTGYQSGQRLLQYLKGELPANLPAGQKQAVLDATKKYLLALPKEALKPGDDAVRDGFGHPVRYSVTGGLGGRPVIISAGADGKFGGTFDDDNIYSDGRGH